MFKITTAMFIVLALVLFPSGTQLGGAVASSEVSPLLTNCVTNLCKAKNEWYGGQVGIRTDMNISNGICSAPGCTFLHRGIWAKIGSTSRYVGLIIEADQVYYPGRAAYLAQTYIPGVGLYNVLLRDVPSGDLGTRGTFRIYWDTGGNYNVTCVENVPSGRSCVYNIDNNRIWDITMLGFRVNSQSGYAALGSYTSTQNQWELGDNYQWYYQTTDGTMNNTATDWLYQTWNIHPAPGGTGGEYYGYCICP